MSESCLHFSKIALLDIRFWVDNFFFLPVLCMPVHNLLDTLGKHDLRSVILGCFQSAILLIAAGIIKLPASP